MSNFIQNWLITPFVINKESKAKYVKYIFRFLIHWKSNQAWVGYLNSTPQLKQWCSGYAAAFYLKFHNAYLSNTFNDQQKLTSLINHYEWLFTHINTETYENKPLPLMQYTIESETSQLLSLNLFYKGKHHREGESCILLELDGKIQYALSFTYMLINGQPSFFIGGLQAGKQDQINLESIKKLTKSLYGLRPKQLLLNALSTLCEFYHIPEIIGVSNENHFYQNSRKKRDHNRVKTNLDEFWLEFAASKEKSGNFNFKPLSNQIDLSEIASKKRSQYKKRQVILDILKQQSNQQLLLANKEVKYE